jgi:hypothetical protein
VVGRTKREEREKGSGLRGVERGKRKEGINEREAGETEVAGIGAA